MLNRPVAVALALVLLLFVMGLLLLGRARQPEFDAPSPSAATSDGSFTAEQQRPRGETTAPETTTQASYTDELGPFSPQRPGVEARIEECVLAEDKELCIKDLVADVAPGAEYIGARTELNIDDSGRNHKVLYYEDPALESCEFTRKVFDSEEETTYHSVIIAGLGAFSDETSEGCVIEY